MDFEQGLQIADEVVFIRTGRRLSSVEIMVLRGCWQEQTYDQIADTTGYSIGYLNRTVAPRLWQTLSDSFGEKTGKKNLRFVLERHLRRQASAGQLGGRSPIDSAASSGSDSSGSDWSSEPAAPLSSSSPLKPPDCQVSWGDAIDVSGFQGRQAELESLTRWICTERCRLVVLLGMGGIGKTTLSVKLAQRILEGERVNASMSGSVNADPSTPPPLHPLTPPSPYSSTPFDFIIWRSLRHAPPLEALLVDLLSFLPAEAATQPNISDFLNCLRRFRCLVLLDGLESFLEASKIGQFRPGYENYGELLRLVGEIAHQSCVLVTSREKFAEVSVLEGIESAVRSRRLDGSPEAVQAIVQDKGLLGSDQQKQQLGSFYGNNPLALKIVATSIRELFEGNIESFLSEETLLLNGIRHLLDQQFNRLSPLEQSIIYWLAVNRDWTTVSELQIDIVPPISKARLLEALEALSLRSLVEKQSNGYSLQPVVMEYGVEQFTERLVNELKTTELTLFLNHAILKATASEQVRERQRKFVLQSIANQLSKQFGSLAALEQQILQILTKLRRSAGRTAGYGAGNLLNLMHHLGLELSNYDFSNLTVWQADLRTASLHQVNFAEADLTNTVFADSRGDCPYIGMNITGATGLTDAQKETLKQLGAID